MLEVVRILASATKNGHNTALTLFFAYTIMLQNGVENMYTRTANIHV